MLQVVVKTFKIAHYRSTDETATVMGECGEISKQTQTMMLKDLLIVQTVRMSSSTKFASDVLPALCLKQMQTVKNFNIYVSHASFLI